LGLLLERWAWSGAVAQRLERRSELALLRALGFRRSALGWLVLAENCYLLALGLSVGLVCGAGVGGAHASAVARGALAAIGGLLLGVSRLASGRALAVLATLRAPLVRHCGANNDDRKSGEMIVEKYAWLISRRLAGLCWGTYVPFVQQAFAIWPQRLRIVFVRGVAYFLIAVLLPLACS